MRENFADRRDHFLRAFSGEGRKGQDRGEGHEAETPLQVFQKIFPGSGVRVEDVPFVYADDACPIAFLDIARDVEVLIGHALGGVDQKNANMAFVNALQRLDYAYLFELFPRFSLFPYARCIYEQIFLASRSKSVSTASRVVPGIGLTMTRGAPRIRFTRVDFPTFGRPRMDMRISETSASSPASTVGGFRYKLDHIREKVSQPKTVRRTDRVDVLDPEGVKIAQMPLLLGTVYFVY